MQVGGEIYHKSILLAPLFHQKERISKNCTLDLFLFRTYLLMKQVLSQILNRKSTENSGRGQNKLAETTKRTKIHWWHMLSVNGIRSFTQIIQDNNNSNKKMEFPF